MGAKHRGRRGARQARRDEREYREYLSEEQRCLTGCIAGRMPAPFMRRVLVRREPNARVTTVDTDTPTEATVFPKRENRALRFAETPAVSSVVKQWADTPSGRLRTHAGPLLLFAALTVGWTWPLAA